MGTRLCDRVLQLWCSRELDPPTDRDDKYSASGKGGELVMSGERADNGALLDYTDLFGPGRAVQISIKNFELQVQPGSPDESRNTRWIGVERAATYSKTFPL